jgi:hypothetical protein
MGEYAMIDLPNTRTFTTVEEYDAAGRAYLIAVLARERDLDCGARILQPMTAEPLKESVHCSVGITSELCGQPGPENNVLQALQL